MENLYYLTFKTIIMNFEVKVKNHASKTVGTLGWVHDTLEKSEVYINTLKSGHPAIFQKMPEEEKGNVVAFFSDNVPYICEYRGSVGTGSVLATYPSEDPMDPVASPGLFGPLTPAAKEVVEEFIDNCVDKLKEYLEEN